MLVHPIQTLITVYLRELKPGELKVLLVLVWKKEYEPSLNISVSRRELSHMTGLSLRAISSAIEGLQSLALIQTAVSRRGYTIQLLLK